ncbi:MAG: hypothetical protein ACR2LX_12930 [Jatrophihabitans sp.]
MPATAGVAALVGALDEVAATAAAVVLAGAPAEELAALPTE